MLSAPMSWIAFMVQVLVTLRGHQISRGEPKPAERPACGGCWLLSSGVARMALKSGLSRALTQCRQRERSAYAPPVLHPEPVR
jgi:hypothetical protein